MNLEVLVEERSAEQAFRVLLPRIVPDIDFEMRVFRGKTDLLKKLPDRLKGYAGWIRQGDVVNRIAVEELEAWFFGDIPALCGAYPRIPASLGGQAKYRDPDAIRGGTWEALERVLQARGYHPGGLAKTVAATEIAQHMDVDANRSRSFQAFRDGVRRLVSGDTSAAAE